MIVLLTSTEECITMKRLVAFVLSMMLLTVSFAFAESPSVTVTDKTRTNAGTVVTTPTKTVEDIMEEIRTKKIISDELSAKLEEIVSDYAGVFRRLNNEA